MDVGLALWTLQSTVAAPGHPAVLHRRFVEAAREAESLGYHSIWVGEHRFWYDGWTPAPLVTLAAAAAATTRLRLGTAMLLLPQHDPRRVARTAAALDELSGGRLDLGVGLGHRDAEFDGLGLERRQRGRRMDAGLDVLLDLWGGGAPRSSPPPVWVGGMAEAAIRRGARRGLSFLLPQTLTGAAVGRAVATIREEAAEAGVPCGRIGVLRDAWVDDDRERAIAWALPRLAAHYHEEAGAWWILGGQAHGFARPDELEGQLARVTDTALVGDVGDVDDGLEDLAARGVDLVALRFVFDVTRERAMDAATRLATASRVLGAAA